MRSTVTAADTPAARAALARFLARTGRCTGDRITCPCASCEQDRHLEAAEEAWAEGSLVRSFENTWHDCPPGCCEPLVALAYRPD